MTEWRSPLENEGHSEDYDKFKPFLQFPACVWLWGKKVITFNRDLKIPSKFAFYIGKKKKSFSRNEYISQMKTWMDHTLLLACRNQPLTLYTPLVWVASLTIQTSELLPRCLLQQEQASPASSSQESFSGYMLHWILQQEVWLRQLQALLPILWSTFLAFSLHPPPHASLHTAHRHCIRWKSSDSRLSCSCLSKEDD